MTATIMQRLNTNCWGIVSTVTRDCNGCRTIPFKGKLQQDFLVLQHKMSTFKKFASSFGSVVAQQPNNPTTMSKQPWPWQKVPFPSEFQTIELDQFLDSVWMAVEC